MKNKSSKNETNRKDDDTGCTFVVSRRSNLPVRCKTNSNDEFTGTCAKESDSMKKSECESHLASSFSKVIFYRFWILILRESSIENYPVLSS